MSWDIAEALERKNRDLESQLAAAKAEIEHLKQAANSIVDGHTMWRQCYEEEQSETKRLREALENIAERYCDIDCDKIAQAALDGGKA
jgi:hypothetical protein